jgi:hypothetical protein
MFSLGLGVLGSGLEAQGLGFYALGLGLKRVHNSGFKA